MTSTDVVSTAARKPAIFKRIFLLVVIPVAIIFMALVAYLLGGRYVETENAYVKADKTALSSEVSGIVNEVFVKDNQWVEEGDPLFQIDPQVFQVEVAKAQAKLAQVETDLLATKASYDEKNAQIELAKTKYDFAVREEKRQANLVNDHFISASNFDQAQQNVHLGVQQIAIAEKELASLAAKLGGKVAAPVQEHPSYMAAKAELDAAKLNLAHTLVRSPNAGVVGNVVKKGEYLRAGNIAMVLVVMGNVWIEANFPEKELTHVDVGQAVEITIDTYPDYTWAGVVDSFSPATGAEFSIIPAQNATGNWVKISQRVPVRIRFDDTADKPQLRPGLSAIVKVDTKHQREFLGLR